MTHEVPDCCCLWPSCSLPTTDKQKKSASEYDDGYLSFKKPDGLDDDDPLPTVYNTLDTEVVRTGTGTYDEQHAYSVETVTGPDDPPTGDWNGYEDILTANWVENQTVDTGGFWAGETQNTSSWVYWYVDPEGIDPNDYRFEHYCGQVGGNDYAYSGPWVPETDEGDFACEITTREEIYRHRTLTIGSPITITELGCGGIDDSMPQINQKYVTITRKGVTTDTLSEPIDYSQLVADLDIAFDAAEWGFSGSFVFQDQDTWPKVGDVVWSDCGDGDNQAGEYSRKEGGRIYKLGYRHRFKVPFRQGAEYYALKYELHFRKAGTQPVPEPPEGEEPEEAQPWPLTLHQAETEVVWNGGGDPLDYDAESWFTPWNDVPAPTEDGTVTIQVTAYKCFSFADYTVIDSLIPPAE